MTGHRYRAVMGTVASPPRPRRPALPARSPWSVGIAVAGVVALLAGCGTGQMTHYRADPYESGIDGTLWRLIASVADPVHAMLNPASSLTPTAESLFDALPATEWTGEPTQLPDLDEAAAVVYDVRSVGDETEFSLFFSSGLRPDVPTDSGGEYSGPGSVFTCSGHRVRFGEYAIVEHETLFVATAPDDCPTELVDAMPGDVAFAELAVFSG